MDLPETPDAGKPPLSRDRIVATGLELLAKEGSAALSMRRIAQALGTGPASLYAHVANKEELDELMLDTVLGEVELPEPDPDRWREQCMALLRAQVEAMTAYPGIASVAWRIMIPVGPNALRHAETLIALLRAGGMATRDAAFAADTLTTYTKAFAVELSTVAHDTAEDGLARRAEPLRAGSFPNLLATTGLVTGDTAADRFTFALNAFLTGLATASA